MKSKQFRAWYKPNNTWLNSIVLGENGNVFIYTVGVEPSNGSVKHNVTFIKEDDVVIEFSTGLKDANGRDIYEGDVVRTIYTDKNEKRIGEVVYVPEAAAYSVKCAGHFLPIMTYKMSDNKVEKIITVVEEVIGNIHENPELLK